MEEFYRWYREGKHLDLLMVPANYVKNEEDRALFGRALTSVDDLPNLRSDLLDRRGLQIETEMEHQRIRFTTNRVGVPHLVKVSYFPNWKVEGAHGVYPVSPHLMMVIPRQQTVTLTYGRNPWEVVGSWITGLTLLCLIGGAVRRRIQDARYRIQDKCKSDHANAQRRKDEEQEVFTARFARDAEGAEGEYVFLSDGRRRQTKSICPAGEENLATKDTNNTKGCEAEKPEVRGRRSEIRNQEVFTAEAQRAREILFFRLRGDVLRQKASALRTG